MELRFDIDVKGSKELQDKLNRAIEDMPEKVGAALYAEAQIIREVSMSRTPVRTGALRASHTVVGPDFSGDDISVTIGVGGAAAPYALQVHENTAAHHHVGQAKFLESAVLEALPTLAGRIADRIDVVD